MAALALVATGCGGPAVRPVTAVPSGASLELRVLVGEGRREDRRPAGRWYRGRVEVVRVGGPLLLVNVVDIEDYVQGVLPGEVGPGWPPETLEAMAVVVRTYAAWRHDQRAGQPWHLAADTRDQRYCGRRCEDARTTRATRDTRGQVLVYDGRPLPAFCHAWCGGRTADVREVWDGTEVPPLAGVRCGWCDARDHRTPWAVTITRDRMSRIAGCRVRSAETSGETASGRVAEVILRCDRRDIRLAAGKLRTLLGNDRLRSTRFTVAARGGGFEFRGRGWGHGVGLCQDGARVMGAAGKTYREILAHYFPGARVETLR